MAAAALHIGLPQVRAFFFVISIHGAHVYADPRSDALACTAMRRCIVMQMSWL